jgi:2,4-dienoyl-CoA reductase-like NADH-dependent reductase (Old Yellow Enzyme family)
MTAEHLFKPFQLKSLTIKNRFVMAPMTRSFSPGGVPTPEVAAYYRRRAAAQTGLILSEGTVVGRPASANDDNIPRFYGEASLQGWRRVIEAVHAVGGAMAPQIWHMGVVAPHASGWRPATPFEGPSGLTKDGQVGGNAMSIAEIQATIQAFAESARQTKALGFDTVEIHGAHGYLIDQFFWDQTNRRTDAYGGKTLAERSRFAVDLVRAVRQAVGPDFPIILRLSQWKQGAYDFKLAQTPEELSAWTQPLADAGVDIFHCSQRRFSDAEFAGSDLNFAGWVKKLTGKATITVGSVGLSGDFIRSFGGENSTAQNFDDLLRRFDRGDFDLVAVGRALLSDAEWVQKVKEGRFGELRGFKAEDLKALN